MITKENFSQELRNIPVQELPADIKELHDFALESSDNGRNWDAYEDRAVKPVIDHYFKKLNEFLSGRKPAAKQDEPAIKQSVRKVLASEAPKEKRHVVSRKEPKPDAKESVDNQSEQEIELVEKMPEELKFIRRCLSLNGKKKSKEDLLRFINAIHRAIVEKRIRKSSPFAKQMNYIQEKLVKKYNEKWEKKLEPMVLNDKTVTEFKEIVSSHKVMSSVSLIKRYITLNGKYGVKERAKKLAEAMKRAIDKGKVTKSDKYIKLYNDMLRNLTSFVKNKALKTLNIQEAELNGLNGIIGCPQQIAKVPLETAAQSAPTEGRIMNSMDFSEMEFETIGFQGKWLSLVGDPPRGFTVMVFGKPKMGKSFLCVDFAGYLARNHGRVLYVAREEGLDYTLQTKIKSEEVKHPNLDVTDNIPADLSPYDFVFLDSVNKLGLRPSDLDALEADNEGTSFIYVFQTRKDGSVRGTNEFMHNVDAVVEVPVKGKAVQFGRFNQGGEMDIFPVDYSQAAGLAGKSPKKSVKSVKSMLKDRDKILYDVLSPDGFTIRMPDQPLFKNKKEGFKFYEEWKKRFEAQGYYSSNYGRIPLIDLDDECSWEEIPERDSGTWFGFRQR